MDDHSISLPSWLIKSLIGDNGIGISLEEYGRDNDYNFGDNGCTNSSNRVQLTDKKNKIGNNANI